MKISHLISNPIIAVAIAIVAVILASVFASIFSQEVTAYANFAQAAKSGDRVKLVGQLVMDRTVEYDVEKDPNFLAFYLQDKSGEVRRVELRASKPQDFECSESIILTGTMKGDIFAASDILPKMPSRSWVEIATIVASFATVVATIIQIVALFSVIKQLKAMKEANFSAAFKTVYDVLQTDQVRKARSHVMNNLRNKRFEEWGKHDGIDDKWEASQVCQSYDIAGIMIRNGLLPKNIVADNWGDSLRTCKPILKPYLDQIRYERNAGEFWDDFEWLCEQADEYQKKVRPDVEEERKEVT